jgi:biopolymer transport protein ExbD
MIYGKRNEIYPISKQDITQMELQLSESKKTKRKLHPSLRIDMTPMVDLGFLLITFFIFTTTISEKKAMRLIMPTEKGKPTPLGESKVLTVVLGQNNKVLAYEGEIEDAAKKNKIFRTNYNGSDGIGRFIREKQLQLQQTDKEEGKDGLVFLIKPGSGCTYKNIIDALDETTINNVKKYMIVDASAEEKQELEKIR